MSVGVVHEVEFEGADGGGSVFGVVAYEAQRHNGVEAGGYGVAHIIVPKAETICCKLLPWEKDARVGFAAGCKVGMANEVGSGYVVLFLEVAQQAEQAGDLRVAEWFGAIVIQFYTDGTGVHICYRTPLTKAGMVRAQIVVEQVVHNAIAANDVVCTYFVFRCGKGFQGEVASVLGGVMNDDKVGFAHAEVCSAHKIVGRLHRVAGELFWL